MANALPARILSRLNQWLENGDLKYPGPHDPRSGVALAYAMKRPNPKKAGKAWASLLLKGKRQPQLEDLERLAAIFDKTLYDLIRPDDPDGDNDLPGHTPPVVQERRDSAPPGKERAHDAAGSDSARVLERLLAQGDLPTEDALRIFDAIYQVARDALVSQASRGTSQPRSRRRAGTGRAHSRRPRKGKT